MQKMVKEMIPEEWVEEKEGGGIECYRNGRSGTERQRRARQVRRGFDWEDRVQKREEERKLDEGERRRRRYKKRVNVGDGN